MSERLPSRSNIVLNAETAERILVKAATQGTVDPDVEAFLRGIVSGESREQIQGKLGAEKYGEVRSRVIAYAEKLEDGRV